MIDHSRNCRKTFFKKLRLAASTIVRRLFGTLYMLSCFSRVLLFVTPMDCSLQGFSVHGILQTRILEWVPFSGGSSPPRFQTHVSCTVDRFFTTWATRCSLFFQSSFIGYNSQIIYGEICPLLRDREWWRQWQPTPVLLPGKSQGQQSLVGCHLWGSTESDMTAAT